MIELCVDGTDGAGKTPLVLALADSLRGRGRSVATCAPFRVVEVFPLWKGEPLRAAALITGVMREFREQHAGAEVLVWDRGWPTAWVTTDDTEALRLFLPFPDATLLLLNTTDVTRMRARKHASTAPWMVEEELITGFNRAYRALADRALPSKPAILSFEPDGEGRFAIDAIVEDVLAKVGLG